MPRGRPLKALDVSQGDQPPRVVPPNCVSPTAFWSLGRGPRSLGRLRKAGSGRIASGAGG